jgi:hypothetical protein
LDVVTQTSLFNYKNLKYIVLPGTPEKNFPGQDFHNRVYSFWKEFWTEVYGSEEGVDGDTFLRQDFVPVVTHGDDIVAVHLYTIFNPKTLATKNHSYFHCYPKDFFSYLDAEGMESVMSIESLTVNSAWRKGRVGVSFGEVMIGCSLNYFESTLADAVIAPTRNDRGVNRMCYKFGFDCYASSLDYRGFDIDIVCGNKKRVQPSPDPKINEIINHLWSSRIDLTGRTRVSSQERTNYGEPKDIAV